MLAFETGIAPSVWWAEDERDLATALDVLHKAREEEQRKGGSRRDEGMVTSG